MFRVYDRRSAPMWVLSYYFCDNVDIQGRYLEQMAMFFQLLCILIVFAETHQLDSCSYEQESKAIIFHKLFPLKAHVYILKRCPQALSQNQCIFMLWPILPYMAISCLRSKQTKRGNAASNRQRQVMQRGRWESHGDLPSQKMKETYFRRQQLQW